MRYLLAILLPPVAVLLCGKPIQFVINLVIWVLGIFLSFFLVGLIFVWIPYIHAILVVHGHMADKRATKIVKAIEQKNK